MTEFRPAIVLYKTSDPDPNMCINLFCEADASDVNVCVLAPSGKLDADAIGVEVTEATGDACIACVGPLANRIMGNLASWFEGSGFTPKAFCDTNTRSFYDFVIAIGEEAYLDGMSTAYVVREGLDLDEEFFWSDLGEVDADGDTVIPEPVPEDLIDRPEEPSHQSIGDREREWLESLPLPGVPRTEALRRAARKLSQRVRVAIRRLHRQFNHPAPRTLQAILRAGGAAKEFIEASKLVKCDSCEKTSPKPRSHPVGIVHGNYIFGDVIGVDVLETADSNRRKYQCFNIVDLATGFQQLELLREVTRENHGRIAGA